jgi:uncharacterized membrane protein YhhN
MTASAWEWLAVACVLAVLDWITVATHARWLERWIKPATLACLVVAAALGRPQHAGVHGWLVSALTFGLLGDLALVWQPADRSAQLVSAGVQGAGSTPAGSVLAGSGLAGSRLAGSHRRPPISSDRLFLLGLLSFLAGHACYAMAMVRFGVDPLSVGFGLILVLLAVFAFGYKIIAGGQQAGGGLLATGITVYIVALSSAVMLGIGTTRLPIAGGILLFAMSDLVLAGDRFVRPRSWAPLTVMVLYHLGQFLLLIGLLR